MPTSGGPRPTRRQFVCPDLLWARVMRAAGARGASAWLREAIEEKLLRDDVR